MSFDLGSINWLAVPAAAVAAFLLGGLWYGLLFAKRWVALSGYTDAQTQAMEKKQPRNFALFFVGDLAAAIVLALLVVSLDIRAAGPGAILGVMLWAGVAAPFGGARHAANDRSLPLWLLDTSYDLVCLSTMGVILGAWR